MRILQLVHQYPPDHVGGVELYSQWLTTALSQRNHTLAVFTRQDRPGQGWASTSQGDVTLYTAWDGVMSPTRRYLAGFANRALVAAFEAVLEEFQPDLVHVQHLFGLPLALVDQVQRRRIPYLVSLHDYWWVCSNANLLTNYSGENCAGPVAYLNCTRCVVARAGQAGAWVAAPAILGSLAWRGQRLRALLAQAQMIVAPSEFVRRWYQAQGIGGNFQVAPLEVEEPPADLPRREWQPGMPLRLLYLGSIAHIKGVHVLLAALRQMQGEVQGQVELWIAGNPAADPAYAQRLQAQATPQVTFLGALTRPQVWQTLAQVDALLVPSLSHESYCFVAREALAVGVPVIAAQMGALTEIVQPGVNGWLLPPGNVAAWQAALQQYVNEPAQLTRLRSTIQKPARREDHCAQVERFYAEMVLEKTTS